jgi:PAS domain S-box-containing protein
MMDLAGYELETLRDSGEFVLCRARQRGNAGSVLVLVAERPISGTLKRLEHEYALAADLDPRWAARPVALTRHDGHAALVLDDGGSEPLDLMLGRPLELTRFLPLGISLAIALGQVHRRGLIHKDIKPANVLVDAAGSVRLTGFGIASRLAREHQAPAPPEVIAGTLAYMAPEQTGRMNRSIDSRSDLYSLGVTLYEMLAGDLPFMASDPMEWVHCHIARQPTPLSERLTDVPTPISAIVLKLLAKTAEERYQTAAGVEADLCRCLAEWGSRGRINTFVLGSHDTPDRLLIPEKLYGRECEIDSLLAAFDRVVAHGSTELVLVSGYSGIGKSAVVNELHKVLVPPRGLFAAGKFDQYKRDIPYTTLAQAFQTLVRQILVKGEAEVDRWRCALTEAVEPNGQLIVSLIPEVEFIIGKQPPVPDLPPRDAQNRFQLVFRRFIGAFARPEHPLALFLDDLQWLDAATLDLLEHLVTHPEVRHLFLVGAYRDNEVGPSHALARTLEAVGKAGVRVREIVLAPLGLDSTGCLIADALRCDPERARPLAELVQEKAGGNPFFTIQFFTALADEGLLAFDAIALAWQWSMDRIRAKNYTDNVVELMAAKLKRTSRTTQELLKLLACLGNVVDIATLTLVLRQSEEAINAELLEAVRAGLVFQHENAYKFLHDRIQQAAYSLIPDEHRAEVHLHIGRVLLARMTAHQLTEHLFDVANQLNRGAGQLIHRDERAQVATIDLRAGRKAKASAAYASACGYFSAGMALLEERDWDSHHELTFRLWLERAECELLNGNFEKAEQLIVELLQRGTSKVEFADASSLKVQLHVLKGEYPRAVDSALACLSLFSIDLPAHPTFQQVQDEYETVWRTLNWRPIESLIDLPLMTDPELQAAMRVLSVLASPAYFTDFNLFCLFACPMVRISMQHGISGASAHGCSVVGFILGPVFHRYGEGYRFVKLACDLVEKHGFIAHQAKVYYAMGTVAFWTQPIETAIDSMRAASRTAIETGDPTFACYGMFQSVTGLLLRSDPLDAVWRESEMALDFALQAKYGDSVDIIRNQQRFIATMQGRSTTFSTFSDVHFDQATFEGQLTGDRMALMIAWYWILKLKARFLSGDYAEALASAEKVRPLLSAAAAQIQLLDYFYYTALTVTACYENASTDAQQSWRELLTAYHEQLREWGETYPPTFADKHALVSAEIARVEGRDTDAMRLYEQAIQSAREHGFVQNEGVAHELAAGFYLRRGAATAARAHLEDARSCFARWGALGKVQQLDQRYPRLREKAAPTSSTATIGTPVEQLDLGTVVKAAQAVSGEIVLEKLIKTLMRIALEHAGAERGLLILFPGDEPLIEAEATTGCGRVDVTLRQRAVSHAELAESMLHYVIRTRESVILDDAEESTLFTEDAYVRQRRPRSVLCLPLVKQAKLVGVIYLENNLTPHAFTSGRIAVLELLASQAAISLENAALYSDLQRSEAFLADGQRMNRTGSFGWDIATGKIVWSEETFRIFGYDQTHSPTLDMVLQRVHPQDLALVQRTIDRASSDGRDFDYEHRLLMPDGSIKYVHMVAHTLRDPSGRIECFGAVMDVTAAKQAEEELHKAQTALAHVTRMTTFGEMTASIAHEVNQPLTGIATYGDASLRWLDHDPPRLEEARSSIRQMINSARHASDVIGRIRVLSRKGVLERMPFDINKVIDDVIAMIRPEINIHHVSLQLDLEPSLPPAHGDRIQLQQVVMNLLTNGIQAMSPVTSRRRELWIRSREHQTNQILISIKDSGVGIEPENVDRLFTAFFTTKPDGMGLGLWICRSIIEQHGGRIWAARNSGDGSTVEFTLDACLKTTS